MVPVAVKDSYKGSKITCRSVLSDVKSVSNQLPREAVGHAVPDKQFEKHIPGATDVYSKRRRGGEVPPIGMRFQNDSIILIRSHTVVRDPPVM